MISYLSHRIAPHNPGRAGRIAAWLVLCALILGAVGFMLGLMLTIGRAHEATDVAGQPLGWRYENSCCSDRDCKPVETGGVRETPDGYVLMKTGEVVGYQDRRVKDSPDGTFHVCQQAGNFDTGRVLCLYRPSRGF